MSVVVGRLASWQSGSVQNEVAAWAGYSGKLAQPFYAVDLKTKKLELIDAPRDISGNPTGEGDDNSSNVAISADGRFVVYQSDASNLVTSPSTANVTDIFIYDRKRLKTYQLSGLTAPTGTGGFVVTTEANNSSAAPSIAGDGKSKTKSYMIAFESRAGHSWH